MFSLSLVLYYSFYTPLLLAQSYQFDQQIVITSMLIILKLFIQFSAAEFSSNITYLENAIQYLQLDVI